MSHQDGLGDNGPETTGLSKPDDGDDRMEKKSENVAHARDGIKLKNLKNSGRLRNSPTTRGQKRSGDINDELNQVGAADRRHAAPECVHERERSNNDDGPQPQI